MEKCQADTYNFFNYGSKVYGVLQGYLLYNMVTELCFSFGSSWLHFETTSTAVSFSKNIRSTSRTKHIDIKFYFVKEKVAEHLIK